MRPPPTEFTLQFDGSDTQRIRELVRVAGLDQATDALYQAVIESQQHGRVIDEINRNCDSQTTDDGSDIQFVVVPGFLYKEYPSSGADGRMLIEAAEQRGWPWQRIPVASTGRLTDNAEIIIQWLLKNTDRPTVLASISKGSSDIVAALQHPAASQAFVNVIGWVNVCGIIRGSPVVDRISRKRLLMLGFRALFAFRRWTFASVTDLRYEGGALRNDYVLPAQMRTVNVVGFPTKDDFVHTRLRKFHNLVGSLGPNDGAILLMDSILAPGTVYPVRGADHYMRPRYQMQKLLTGLLHYVSSHENASGQSC